MGLLDLLEGWSDGGPEDSEAVGTFSVVVSEATQGIRRLPSLYMGSYLYFTHRDAERVGAILEVVTDAAIAAAAEAVYALQACSFEGHIGLYGRDLFLRDPRRRRLVRRGLRFAEDPFVRFTPSGTFRCQDFGEFRPEFVLLFDEAEEPERVVETTGALLPFRFAAFRLGRMDVDELSRLNRVVHDIPSFSARDEGALVAALSRSLT